MPKRIEIIERDRTQVTGKARQRLEEIALLINKEGLDGIADLISLAEALENNRIPQSARIDLAQRLRGIHAQQAALYWRALFLLKDAGARIYVELD